MAFYSDIASYLKLGYPEPFSDVGRWGNSYVYVGPSSALTATATTALVGVGWADGLLVNSAVFVPFKNNSAKGELTVRTVAAIIAGTFGSTLEQSWVELTWHPVERPLQMHPKFRSATATTSAGAYDLRANASDSKPNWQHVLGWQLETDANLKSQYKYRLITNGQVSGTITTIPAGSNAEKFVKLLEAGWETYQDWFPVWTKHSVYTGSSPPSTGSIGVKVSAPSGAPSTSPSSATYEYVKTADHAIREGITMRWKRTEEWTGTDKVYADAADVFPPT